jgi:hypothetical protein
MGSSSQISKDKTVFLNGGKFLVLRSLKYLSTNGVFLVIGTLLECATEFGPASYTHEPAFRVRSRIWPGPLYPWASTPRTQIYRKPQHTKALGLTQLKKTILIGEDCLALYVVLPAHPSITDVGLNLTHTIWPMNWTMLTKTNWLIACSCILGSVTNRISEYPVLASLEM